MSNGPGRPKAALNNKLVRALARADMTQSELAEKIGVSKQSVNYWTQIGVPALRCEKVAKALRCTVRDLRPDVFR